MRFSAGSQLRMVRRLTLAVTVSIAAASCAGGDERLPKALTTTPSPTSLTTSTTPPSADGPGIETTIRHRYEAFWNVRLEANRVPVDPRYPKLPDYATGEQLDQVRAETRQRHDAGLAIRLPPNSVSQRKVEVENIEPQQAVLRDCAVDDGVVYRVSSGQVVDDAIVTRSVLATMRKVDGVWKVASTRVVQQWEGVAGCAASPDFS